MIQRDGRAESEEVLVVGSDPAVAVLARNLPADVVFQGFDESITRRVADDVRDSELVADVGQITPGEEVTTAVVATPDDGTNLLVAQRLRLESDVDVVVRLNDPRRRGAFTDLEAEVLCAPTTVGEALAELYTERVRFTE